jgi:hypothetical protein
MKLTTFTALPMLLLSAGHAFAGAGAPVPPTGEQAGFYVARDLASGKCQMTTTYPNSLKYKLMGTFKTGDEAQKAMAKMEDCK